MSEASRSAGSLFREGKLVAAIDAANAAVRNKPRDLASRVLLAELLVFAGRLERADVVLDAAAQLDSSAMVGVAEFRQLLRAEIARRQLRTEGRIPEFLAEPTPVLRMQLAAQVALRAGDAREAARLAREAETLRPRATGHHDEVAFDDFRDGDDLSAGYFEVLTTTGRYFWIPIERVSMASFHPPKRPRDLVWRRASLAVADGPDGDVYLPAIYPSAAADPEEQVQLGRATEWIEEEDGLVRGRGQRVFLVGEGAVPMMELRTIRFDESKAAP